MKRRSIVAAISIAVHAIALIALATADLWRPISEWPTPRSALAFVEDIPRPVHLEDIELSRPSRVRAATTGEAPRATSQIAELAPITPPSGVAKETGDDAPLSAGSPGPLVSESGTPDVGVLGPSAPPPPPPPQAPVRLHSGIRAPQRIVNVTPVYPIVARNAHVEGVVIIEATIDERGNVVRTQLLRSIPLLDDAAMTAVRQWKFSPTLLNGVAVPIVMTVTVNFMLN